MPVKFNAARRHKFDKTQYRVINWAEYSESLRQRGGQRRYSDLAIETCLTLRTAYRLPFSASAAKMPNTRRPGAVVVSICAPWPAGPPFKW